ncbi:MAG: hypothetical protein K6343_06135 [Caldisericaceae bacterium]
MPEIVEVEFLREEIYSTFVNRKVEEASLNKEDLSNVTSNEISTLLENQKLLLTDRVGKVLTLSFSNDINLIIHFLLTGFTRLIDKKDKENYQFYIVFDNNKILGISGIMKPGFIKLYKTNNIYTIDEIKKLGVDVLSKNFTLDKFKILLRENCKKSIKEVLIDQEKLAGLGNAYTDEILFLSKIHPKRKCKDISNEEIENLYKNIFTVIELGKKYGGASELSFVHLNGEKGKFHLHFNVHKRENQKCPVCGDLIESIKIGGRTSYFCPKCQR